MGNIVYKIKETQKEQEAYEMQVKYISERQQVNTKQRLEYACDSCQAYRKVLTMPCFQQLMAMLCIFGNHEENNLPCKKLFSFLI